jgi:hypothetical protein
MKNLPEWADPESTIVQHELIAGIEPTTWQRFLGELAEGGKVQDTLKLVGISRAELNGATRTNPVAKEQFEQAKLEALRRNIEPEEVEEVMVAIMTNEHSGYLNHILKHYMIDPHAFYMLMTRDPEVRALYEEARQIQAENMADHMQAIADDGENDTYTDDKGRTRVDQDIVQRSRLRVDTMKWRMSKLHWKRFGDKVQNETTMNVKVDQVAKLDQGRKRLEALNKQRATS